MLPNPYEEHRVQRKLDDRDDEGGYRVSGYDDHD
jgi:hypothetical protein